MSKLDKFTFLMPIFNLKDERYRNFKYTLSRIKEVTDNILVVEQVKNKRSTKSKKYTESLGVNYLPVLIDDDSIHKSKLINKGTDNIQTEFVWVNDSDCYLKFQKVIDQLDFRHNFIQPYDVGKYISKEETQKIFNGESVQVEFAYSKLNETGQHITPGTLYYVSMYGALSFLYKKKAFYEIGGMNEKYTGWGLEDNSLCMRMFEYKDSRLDIINMSGIHLYHPRGNYSEKLQCDNTANNISVYEEEFKDIYTNLHEKLRSFYAERYKNKIAIIGIERSGTNMLSCGLGDILSTTMHNECFNVYGVLQNVPDYAPSREHLKEYCDFFLKKSNCHIKHLDTAGTIEAVSTIFSYPSINKCRLEIKKNLIKSCAKIIILTRTNFLDWCVSFELAHQQNEWIDIEYTTRSHTISKYRFDKLYDLWYTYHDRNIRETILMCKRYNKKYKIIDYDDLIYTDGNFNDIEIDITYKDILNETSTRRQKTKENTYYIKNYEEVLNWFNNVKKSS